MSAASVLGADIPSDTGGPYVVAAYVVFLVLLLVYVGIMAQRLTGIAKRADDLSARLDHVQNAEPDAGPREVGGPHERGLANPQGAPATNGSDAAAVGAAATPGQAATGASS